MQVIRQHPAHPALWSLLMVPVFLVVFVVASSLETAAMHAFGLSKGDLLLMAHSASAWVVFVLLLALLASPLVLGMWFAYRAVRDTGGWPGWVGLVLNAALLAPVVYQCVDQIRMSYWPG
jgi:hypothetical protein